MARENKHEKQDPQDPMKPPAMQLPEQMEELVLNLHEQMKDHSPLPFSNRHSEKLELIENKGRDHTLIATKCDLRGRPKMLSRLPFPVHPEAL